MDFLVHQLDNLDYAQAEPLIDDYIEGALESFANSRAGKAHIRLYPEGGGWIEVFIEFALRYGGYTLPTMTKSEAKSVMEDFLPRRMVLSDPSEADDAIPELVAFWTYLHEVYRFRSAKAIAKYLESIADQFPEWMFDPHRGGMAKQLMMEGMAKGFDMTTQEGLQAFQASQQASLKSASPDASQTQGAKPKGGKTQGMKTKRTQGKTLSAGLPPLPPVIPMTTPPDDMQAAFDRLGIELPPEGAPVNLMALMEQFLAGIERMDPEEAEAFIQGLEDSIPDLPELDDADLDDLDEVDPIDALFASGKNPVASLRAAVMHNNLAETPPLSEADRQVLREQSITATSPGTILQDFQTLLDLAASEGIPVSGKLQQFVRKALPDLNQRLSQPLTLAMQQPQQKSYPNLHGLYLLLRATGLTTVATQGKQMFLVTDPDIYASWQALNPTEQYLSLLEVWFLRSHPEMLGEERSGPLLVGDRCLQGWQRIAAKAKLSVPDYSTQQNFAYYPGLYNLALMEMFGLITITHGKPEPGKGWRFKTLQSQPFGKALMTLLRYAYDAVDYEWPGMLDSRRPIGDFQPVLQPYFPEWRHCLAVPKSTFQPGRYIFKVSLGRVWRRIAIPAEATLATLSGAILDSVDFDDDHLYEFTYKNPLGRTIRAFHPYMDSADLFATEVLIGELPLAVGATMDYLFDFGDCWEFKVELEAIEPIPEEPTKGFQTAITRASKGKSAKGKSTKGKVNQPKRPKIKVEILERHGKAPEQYPNIEDW
ncbi:MAG: hypothetical protein ACHWZW_02675 [Spirulina sp.]